MGPALETFIGMALLLLCVLAVVAFTLRRPAARLTQKIRDLDKDQLRVVEEEEQRRLDEESQRKAAIEELERDCGSEPVGRAEIKSEPWESKQKSNQQQRR